MGERAFDHSFDATEVVRQTGAAEGDERRVDVRPRPKHSWRHGMESRSLRHQLHQDGDRAVRLGRGLCEKAIGDLALHHHGPELDPGQTVEALCDQRRGDVVREVRHELGRAWRYLGQIELHGIADTQLDVRPACQTLRQFRSEGRVELDRVDPGDTIREIRRQYAEAGADLQYDILGIELRKPADHAEDV